MGKKGMVGFVAVIIGAVIAMVILANLFIPQVKQVTDGSAYSESLVHNNAPSAQNATLSLASRYGILDNTLTISGLTLTSNYTVDYNTGIVTFKTTTVNGTYTAAYEYAATGYVSNTSERVLLGILVFVGILGVVLLVFKGFGLMKGD